jgi:hypothetical protein
VELPENTDVIAIVVSLVIAAVGWGWAIWQAMTRHRRERSLTVKSLLKFLANRRVLYSPYSFEEPAACVASVHDIRTRLQSDIERLQDIDGNTGTLQRLESMQMACRAFLDRVPVNELPWSSTVGLGGQDWIAALSNLRLAFDEQMNALYEQYRIQRYERPIDYGPMGRPIRMHHDVPDYEPPSPEGTGLDEN